MPFRDEHSFTPREQAFMAARAQRQARRSASVRRSRDAAVRRAEHIEKKFKLGIVGAGFLGAAAVGVVWLIRAFW